MTVKSDKAREAVEQLRREMAALERCGEWLTRAQREHVTDLRIRRNLLAGLLMVRAREGKKKIVDLELWRWGYAPAATMLRYGLSRDDITTGSARGMPAPGASPTRKRFWHPPRDGARCTGDDDPFTPQAG